MRFLGVADIFELHARGIERWGGDGAHKPDTMDRVDGALGAARNASMQNETGEPEPLAYAAGILTYLGRAQYFMDGSKRAAWGGCVRSLELNGYTIVEEGAVIASFVTDMVTKKLGIQDVADWLGDRIQVLP